MTIALMFAYRKLSLHKERTLRIYQVYVKWTLKQAEAPK